MKGGRRARQTKRLVEAAQQRQPPPKVAPQQVFVVPPEGEPLRPIEGWTSAAPSIPDVARRIRDVLADFDEPLTPWQNEVMDLLHVALERGGSDALTPEFARRAREVVHVALYGRPAPGR